MITIIGAGLSGLAVAYRLKQADIPFHLLEAQSVVGGRIQPADNAGAHQDLGPSWVWPYAQPVVETWFDELGIDTFEQYESGDGLLDRDAEATRVLLPSQHGIARVNGGTHAIIRALLDKLVDNDGVNKLVTTNCIVSGCSVSDAGITIHHEPNGEQLDEQLGEQPGQHVTTNTTALVIATPPRHAAALLPADSQELEPLQKVLLQTPTWMAPHAKVVMHYEEPFWREQGLSGRIASQLGPLSEMHDHCGPDGQPAALFGFAGIPASQRKDLDSFKAAVEQQLLRCFGSGAPRPTHISIKDWATNPFTCAASDLTGPMAHPSVIHDVARSAFWDKRLWIAASETSRISPGLIEGAFARADAVAQEIVQAASGVL